MTLETLRLYCDVVRLRSFSHDLGNRYVTANIPAAQVETVENGQVVTHHIAGVGKIDRQSPVMQTKAIQINFNPFWNAPVSIVQKDIIPKLIANPHALEAMSIRVFDGYREEQVTGDIDLVVVGNAISRGNPELEPHPPAAVIDHATEHAPPGARLRNDHTLELVRHVDHVQKDALALLERAGVRRLFRGGRSHLHTVHKVLWNEWTTSSRRSCAAASIV